MASVTDICNAALVKLGEKRITDAGFATPTNERERVCAAHYERIRDRELRLNRWNFSVKRASIAPDEDDPVYEFDYAYTVPSDMLRLIDIYQLDVDSEWPTAKPLYKLESNKILTNTGDEINVRYVRKVTVVNDMDPIFRDALACALAVELCERLPGKANLKTLLSQEYRNTILMAAQVGALENPRQDLPESSWITCRV